MKMTETFFFKVYRGFRSLVYFACVIIGVHFIDAQADDYSFAKNLVNQRKWTEALPILEKLHKEAPSSTLIRLDLAITYLRLNERAKAVTLLNGGHFTRQAKNASTTFVSEEGLKRYEEGLILLKQLQLKASVEKFEKAQLIERDHYDILVRMSEGEILLGDFVDARKWLARVEEVYGLSGEALYWRLILDVRTELKSFPVWRLDQLQKEYSSSVTVGLLRVEFLRESGKRTEALAELENLSIKFPKVTLFPVFSLAIRAETLKDATLRPALEQEIQMLLRNLEKDTSTVQLSTAEWGGRLYSTETLLKILRKSSESLNVPASTSTY
jgi:tetratricopeptide (TPR) repeat protein